MNMLLKVYATCPSIRTRLCRRRREGREVCQVGELARALLEEYRNQQDRHAHRATNSSA